MEITAVDAIVIHCSATSPDRDIGAREIDRMHRSRRMRKIGYHRVIRRNGLIEYGRTLIEQGAGVWGHNKHTVHICMVGGVSMAGEPVNNFTASQWASLTALVREFKAIYPRADVLGHRDFSPDINGDGTIDATERIKECPCFEVSDWWRTQNVV